MSEPVVTYDNPVLQAAYERSPDKAMYRRQHPEFNSGGVATIAAAPAQDAGLIPPADAPRALPRAPDAKSFKPRAKPKEPGDIIGANPALQAFSEKHCTMLDNGKARCCTFRKSPMYPGQWELEVSTRDDFLWWHRNLKIAVQVTERDENGKEIGKRNKKFQLVPLWLKWDGCRQYGGGKAFMPHTDARDVGPDPDHLTLNTWQGFTVKATPGDWSLFRAHIFDNLCGGVQEYYDYLLRWMAWVVQHRKKSGVAILLRGDEEGTGKGFFANHFGVVFGSAYLQLNSPDSLIGKFNPHLEFVILVNADEALFVGDPRHRNALWGLVTEPTITIEPKNMTAYKAVSYLNLIITTNAKHALNLSRTARRFFAQDVVPNQMGNAAYFDAIEKQLEAGGYGAMLHDLMAMDLTGFDIRKPPQTDARRVQQELSRSGIDALVEKACSEAVVPCPHSSIPGFSRVGGDFGFDEFIDRHTDPELRKLRALRVKRALRDHWKCTIGADSRTRDGADILRGIKWPPLDELRALFVERHGPQDWLVPDTDAADAVKWVRP